MAKAKQAATNGAETATIRRVSGPKVEAGDCPVNADHQNTTVYKTIGRTRHCKCNDCGRTWKKIGPFADELREYATELSSTLRDAPREDVGEGPMVMMTSDLANEISAKLYELATT